MSMLLKIKSVKYRIIYRKQSFILHVKWCFIELSAPLSILNLLYIYVYEVVCIAKFLFGPKSEF